MKIITYRSNLASLGVAGLFASLALTQACATAEGAGAGRPPLPPEAPEEPPDPTFGVERDEAPAESKMPAVSSAPAKTGAAVVEHYEALPECLPAGDACFPPMAFTERLCQSTFPGVSISMLKKGGPWARGYVRVEQVGAVNTFGGPAGESRLSFGEEVVILHKSGGQGPMQVSGGGFVVLRWDGTCATLAEHELVTWVPGAPGHAPFVWNYIDTNIQKALLRNQQVGQARKKQKKQCRGGRLGRQTPACLSATTRLNETVVLLVRTGIELPTPEHLP